MVVIIGKDPHATCDCVCAISYTYTHTCVITYTSLVVTIGYLQVTSCLGKLAIIGVGVRVNHVPMN